MNHTARGFRLLLVTVAAAACQGLPQQTGYIATAPINASAREIRVRAVQLGRLFSEEIERAADSIRAISDEPSIRRHALLWKMYAIPAAHEAVLLPDPALSILDVWTFAMQMEEYFDRGAGQNVFGPHQSIALDAVRRLDRATLDQALLVSDSTADAQGARDTLTVFAENYPIQGPQFERASVALVSANLLGGDAATAVAAVGDINQAVGEITDRLAFHNEYLLKQASWAALELLEDLAQDTSVTATLASATAALDNASVLAEALPSLVASERAVVIEALHTEFAVLIEAVDEQRGATLALFTEELAELIEAVHAERIIVIEALTAERVATIEAIVPLMQDAIDHAVWRAAQLLAAMGLFVVLLAGAVVFALRRGRGQPPVLNPTENVR
jgi:hypothetical protein